MGLAVGAAYLTTCFADPQSLGGSFSTYAAVMDCVRVLPGAIRSGRDFISRPDNSLDGLEKSFAKNKCYIPQELWPKILAAFIAARQNPFSQDAHTKFLEFTLSFTTCKTKPKIVFTNNMSADDVKNELHRRIDVFFNDYDDSLGSIEFIKLNVSKFINSLDNETSVGKSPRYIYLHGPGGLGKTYFVQTLSRWIEELIPNGVCFEDIVINSPVELEGTDERPGSMLKIVRNQLVQNKRGSCVMIDEATWLNDPSMTAPAKRTFNASCSKISTSYFGTGIDGDGISLKIPPMLVFIANNDTIQDAALESRFDVVKYPVPKQQALIAHALRVAEASEELWRVRLEVNNELVAQWVRSLEEKHRNFRYVEGNVEVFLLTQAIAIERQKLAQKEKSKA